MGFAKKLHNIGRKFSPIGGKYDPATALHRGINKAVGIEPDFMAPGQQGLYARMKADREGTSQWQKFNPTNIRDFNATMGYDYASGGRDKPVKTSPQTVGGGVSPYPAMPTPPGMGGTYYREGVNPGGNKGLVSSLMQRQLAQIHGLRNPPSG